MNSAVLNAQVFNGEQLLDKHAVIINGQKILDVIPQHQLPSNIDIAKDLKGNTLIPGLIDLQVNGGGGLMFNNAPQVETLKIMAKSHRHFGTTSFLPTLITDNYDVMRKAIAAVDEAISEGVAGVEGIHLEGPFLNSEKKGAHDANKFCLIDDEALELIGSLKRGKTIITIAPEMTSSDMIKRISDKGIIICAGHSNANYAQARQGLDAGVKGFTHLFNAMTPLQSREPGMVGAALEDENSWFGIIADGYHMHPAAFKVAVSAKQKGGAILVTDAMATVGASEKSFVLDGETIYAIDGRCENAAGSLAGSDLDMISAVNNAAKFANINWFEAVRMASVYPARALGLEKKIGFIKPGFNANFNEVDQNHKIINSWINGQTSS